MERKARSSLLLFLFLFWSSRATEKKREVGTNSCWRENGGMEKRSYFPRIPEAVGLSRRHSSYVDSILTDIAGNPVRRVRHTDTGPFCKTANRPIDGAPTRPSIVSSPLPIPPPTPTILTHLTLVVVDYSPSKPLSPVEPCRSVATRPATPRNVGSGIMQKAAAEQCAPRRCTRLESGATAVRMLRRRRLSGSLIQRREQPFLVFRSRFKTLGAPRVEREIIRAIFSFRSFRRFKLAKRFMRVTGLAHTVRQSLKNRSAEISVTFFIRSIEQLCNLTSIKILPIF